MFNATGGQPHADVVEAWIVEQLGRLHGVERALLVRSDENQPADSRSMGHRMGMGDRMMFEHAEITHINPPRFDTAAGRETVSIISDLLSASNAKVGQLVVTIRFDSLIESAMSHGWKQGDMTTLIDNEGKVLACSVPEANRQPNEDAFTAVVKEMGKRTAGTIMGPSGRDSDVIGFYRLNEAPWTLVLTARETQILAPIDRFRHVFLLTGALFTLFVLILVRIIAGRTVASILEVSRAAQRVANGDYQVLPATGSVDEVGHLVRSFNTMVTQLEERMRLKEALDLAMEVQQNLLPVKPPD